MTTAIVNAKLVLENGIVEGKILLFDQNIKAVVASLDGYDVDEVIDAKGEYASAGFIDIHIHGSGGADVMDATPEALHTISKTLLQTGTTSFLATTMTMSPEAIDRALQNIRHNTTNLPGAKILGAHLEGPFINAQKHGAQDRRYVQNPDLSLIEKYKDEVKMITLAPEVEGAEHFIKSIREKYPHIVLSIGHSEASYEESMQSFDWGISHATHLFNAMPALHHRAPGIVGAVFDAPDVTCDIIADTIHVHPSLLNLSYRVKKGNLMLITDAMRAGCMKRGIYDLGGQRVEVDKGEARLTDGTLAGSVLRMNEALHSMLTLTEMNRLEVVQSVTKRPAEKLRIKKGLLKEGYDADIVIFDENFSMIETIIAGEKKGVPCLDF